MKHSPEFATFVLVGAGVVLCVGGYLYNSVDDMAWGATLLFTNAVLDYFF
jgi:hypothetical protein